MPKELIANAQDRSGSGFDVEVRWGRGGECDVQIATVMRPAQDGQPQNLTELVASWDDLGQSPEHQDGARGLYSSLDRYAVNRLIRVLRRARDVAFGQDE